MWEESAIGWTIMSKKITVTNSVDLQSASKYKGIDKNKTTTF